MRSPRHIGGPAIAGAAASAVGHAILIALAVWALPWLRVRPKPPPPVIAVALVSEADLADLARNAAPTPAPPVAAPVPAPPPSAGPRFLPPEESEPEPPPAAPESIDLAPAFDATSPLGFPEFGATVPEAEAEPPPVAEEEIPPDPGELRERHLRALARAIERARVYPPAAVGRGLMGTAGLYIEVGRDGGLIEARLVASTGSASLDRAALDAVRRAKLPAAPDDLPGASFAFTQSLRFEAR